ncbi:hypothetical protein Ahy_A02g006655 [Arachis hypogaea]|uniref:Uncharacterized protein n=1 Tax=Arachis hypogaea TaxID=3818 RepID=A0A445EA88_ARAHY|nr:hypothetical protein Ahy_A02g006655 [Arachis hypogaea]
MEGGLGLEEEETTVVVVKMKLNNDGDKDRDAKRKEEKKKRKKMEEKGRRMKKKRNMLKRGVLVPPTQGPDSWHSHFDTSALIRLTIICHPVVGAVLSIFVNRVFTELSEEKKTIVEEMRFDALRHIPKLNVSHKLLRKLILSFDLYHGFLDTRYS